MKFFSCLGSLLMFNQLLSNLSGRISTSPELIDIEVVKGLNTRCLSHWRILKFDKVYVKLIDGDAVSLVSDDNME
jgi:hypothetical protein